MHSLDINIENPFKASTHVTMFYHTIDLTRNKRKLRRPFKIKNVLCDFKEQRDLIDLEQNLDLSPNICLQLLMLIVLDDDE